MATVAFVCPDCKEYIRTQVVPARVVKTNMYVGGPKLRVHFEDQLIPHTCKEQDGEQCSSA